MLEEITPALHLLLVEEDVNKRPSPGVAGVPGGVPAPHLEGGGARQERAVVALDDKNRQVGASSFYVAARSRLIEAEKFLL